MGLFAQFATSKKSEVEGVVVSFGGENVDGTFPQFRIARMGKTNKRYQRMLEAETKPHIHAIRNDNLSPEIDEAISLKLFIATILLNWANLRVIELFTEAEHSLPGGYLPFTAANAEKLLKALPELYEELKSNATKMSNFRAEEISEDSKN